MSTDEHREIEIHQEDDIVTARSAGREIAQVLGFRPVDCTQVATAISELARNMLLYAERGVIHINVVRSGVATTGLEIVATDSGPGIEDSDAAMRDGYSTSKGLGLGLPGTKRLMDEFELQSARGTGTRIRAVKWLAA